MPQFPTFHSGLISGSASRSVGDPQRQCSIKYQEVLGKLSCLHLLLFLPTLPGQAVLLHNYLHDCHWTSTSPTRHRAPPGWGLCILCVSSPQCGLNASQGRIHAVKLMFTPCFRVLCQERGMLRGPGPLLALASVFSIITFATCWALSSGTRPHLPPTVVALGIQSRCGLQSHLHMRK